MFLNDSRLFAAYYARQKTAIIYGLAQIAHGHADDPAEFAKQVLVEANEWPPRTY